MKVPILLAVLLSFVLAVPAGAQRRSKKPKPPPKPAAPSVDTVARRDAARRVADQLTSLSRFLYLLGGVTKSVEAADRAIESGQPSVEAIRQNEHSKAVVREAIHNVRIGLDQLENDFSGSSSLRAFYHHMIGATDLASAASRQADAGDFDAAGRSLLDALAKLTDVLVAMGGV